MPFLYGGTNPADPQLVDVAGLTPTDNGVIIGNGTNFVVETSSTLLTSIGLGTGNSPQFTGIELSHATANTLTASAGLLSIEGVAIPHLNYAPTWTAVHTFTANPKITGTDPELTIYETDAPSDNKYWGIYAGGGGLRFITKNDALNTYNEWL